MDHAELEKLIFRILSTEDQEIDCEQVFDLIARYVDLGISGADARRLMPLVHEHLVQCGMCAELYATLHDLAMMEEQGALPTPDDLLDEIVAGDGAPAAGPAPGSPWPPAQPARPVARPPVGRPAGVMVPAVPPAWNRRAWSAAAVALVAAVALGAWGWSQSSELARARQDAAFIASATRAMPLAGTEQDPDAHGFLFVGAAEGKVLLTVVGLNPLPSGQVYQVWISTGAGVISAGTFAVGSDQRGRFFADLGAAMAGFTSLAITPEPKGGSSAPTTSPVCVWGSKL